MKWNELADKQNGTRVQESKRRQKMEDEERRQRERALKKAEFEKWKNPPKPNFVISKRSGSADDEEEVGLPFSRGYFVYDFWNFIYSFLTWAQPRSRSWRGPRRRDPRYCRRRRRR